MLGMGSGWWSFAGLIVDIAGFGVLAWDLLPDYRLNRAWRSLEEATRYAVRLKDPQAYSDDAADAADAGLEFIREAVAARSKLDRSLVTSNLYLAADHIKGYELSDIYAVRDSAPFSFELFLKAKQGVESALSAEEIAIHQRKRPPLRFGIFLVIVGFLMQAWGSIPV